MTDQETHFADMALNYGMMLANTRIALRNLVAAAEPVIKEVDATVSQCSAGTGTRFRNPAIEKLREETAAAKEVLK